MKAFILAGGMATRLRPITENLPKALVPIEGKPFLSHTLNFLSSQGIRKVVLLVGYHADKIIQEFGDGKKLDLEIEYQTESEPLGTGGALIQARHYFGDHDLVLNGDTYCEFDIDTLKQFHLRHKADFTVCVLERAGDSEEYGGLDLDPEGRVVRFREKAKDGNFLSAGCYMTSKRFIERLSTRLCSLEMDLLPEWIKNKERIFGFVLKEKHFYDIGTYKRLEKFREYIKNHNAY